MFEYLFNLSGNNIEVLLLHSMNLNNKKTLAYTLEKYS